MGVVTTYQLAVRRMLHTILGSKQCSVDIVSSDIDNKTTIRLGLSYANKLDEKVWCSLQDYGADWTARLTPSAPRSEKFFVPCSRSSELDHQCLEWQGC
jgi:hypothetical protein